MFYAFPGRDEEGEPEFYWRGKNEEPDPWCIPVSEILSDGPENEGNFEDGAHVQELINAVELSCRERRWVAIPIPR